MNVATVNRTTGIAKGPSLRVFKKQVPFEEGVARATEKNLIVVSSLRLTLALPTRESRLEAWGEHRCWSGTMTAYTEPRKKFGKTVERVESTASSSVRWVFPVPEEYRDIRNGILVVEHPNYTIEVDGKNRVIRAATVDVVEHFPQTGGDCRWYSTDPKHGIPCGNPIVPFETEDARQLLRNGTRVGPIVRTTCDTGVKVPYLQITESPSSGHYMMVEA